MTDRKLGMQKGARFAFSLLVDALIISGSIYLAVMLRYNGHMSQWQMGRVTYFSPLMMATYIVMRCAFGVQKITWRYADMRDMLKLLFVCVASVAVNLLVNRLFHLRYPRLVISISGVIAALFLIASRYIWILTQDYMFTEKSRKHVRRALIVGADVEGIKLAQSLNAPQKDEVRRVAVAFLDEDIEKLYRKAGGVPVEGTLADVAEVARRKHIDEVILAGGNLNSNQLRGVYLRARRQKCNVLLVGESGALREARIEDVLAGWTDEPLDARAKEALARGRFAVTGAAGRVGAELARQLTALAPEALSLIDMNENGLCALKRALGDDARYRACDVCDAGEISRAFAEARPAMVFHAAAFSREEIAEGNALRLIKTNVYGLECAWRAARDAGAKAFTYISGAGAYQPRNLTDASRALGERALAMLAAGENGMKTLCVRISGVVTSESGELDRYRALAARGEPITVRKDEKQSFLSAGDAASGLMGICALEDGGAYLIDPEDPTDMAQLARAIAREMHSDAQPVILDAEAGQNILEAQKAETAGARHVFRAKETALPTEILDAALLEARAALQNHNEFAAEAALRKVEQETTE